MKRGKMLREPLMPNKLRITCLRVENRALPAMAEGQRSRNMPCFFFFFFFFFFCPAFFLLVCGKSRREGKDVQVPTQMNNESEWEDEARTEHKRVFMSEMS